MSWTEDQPIVSVRDVHKSFGELEVLKGVSLDVMKGEVICIIGPSGSGKSTLIRCINALNDIQQGSILVEGIEDRTSQSGLGHRHNVYPHEERIPVFNGYHRPIQPLYSWMGNIQYS